MRDYSCKSQLGVARNAFPKLQPCKFGVFRCALYRASSSGSRGGGGRGGHAPPPGPVKISHKKDGRQRLLHRFHVSWPPPYPAAGSATGISFS